MEQIVEKIQKLLALSKSQNEHEAAAAAARAAELMTKYQISEAEIPSDEEGSEIISELDVEPGVKKGWKGQVIYGVAYSLGIQSFYTYGTKAFRLVGRDSDLSAAKYMISYLVSEINRLADKAWNKAKMFTAEHGKAWKNSFRVGAAMTVKGRLKEMRDSTIRDARNAGQEQALIKIDKRSAIIEDHLRQNYNIRSGRPTAISSASGLGAGKEAGKNINLGNNKGLNPGAKRLKS